MIVFGTKARFVIREADTDSKVCKRCVKHRIAIVQTDTSKRYRYMHTVIGADPTEVVGMHVWSRNEPNPPCLEFYETAGFVDG